MKRLGRVLVISYYFAPQNTMGAIRPTKFAKYLARMGYEVTVICGEGMTGAKDPILQRDLEELTDVHVVKTWNPLKDIKKRKQAKTKQIADEKAPAKAASARDIQEKNLIGRIADVVYLYLWVLGDRSFQRRAKRELKSLSGTYDAVFSSYAPLSVHEVAYAAKKQGIAKRWIADFRDEVNVSFRWQERYRRRYMRMISENADLLTAVSNGILKQMHFDDIGRALSNGYDREDIDLMPIQNTSQEPRKFTITYCGLFHSGRKGIADRDIKPFFRVMREVVDCGICHEDELNFVYAGSEGDRFDSFAKDCGFEACVTNHGLVTREKSLELQKQSDVLLITSWNTKGQTGILTGKFFEYMMMDKPIVCLVAGDLPDSELAQVMKKTGIGFCCEEAEGEKDRQALVDYCMNLVKRWKEGRKLLVDKNTEECEKLSYPSIAKILSDWIHE